MNEPDHPLDELLLDLQSDELERLAHGVPIAPEALAEASRKAAALLERLEYEQASEQDAGLVTRSPSRAFTLHFEPLATLAAADLVKATVRWDGGVVRLLQSPLRPDLAAEVSLDEARRAEYVEHVFYLGLDASEPLAVLADVSPVFTGLSAVDFSTEREVSIEAIPLASLTPAQVESLRHSRSNLRDPSGMTAYDDALARSVTKEG